MILVNTDYITGKTLETLRLVSGRRGGCRVALDKDIKIAEQIMIDEANALGADAIINIRYIMGGSCVFVNGTAVKFV